MYSKDMIEFKKQMKEAIGRTLDDPNLCGEGVMECVKMMFTIYPGLGYVPDEYGKDLAEIDISQLFAYSILEKYSDSFRLSSHMSKGVYPTLDMLESDISSTILHSLAKDISTRDPNLDVLRETCEIVGIKPESVIIGSWYDASLISSWYSFLLIYTHSKNIFDIKGRKYLFSKSTIAEALYHMKLPFTVEYDLDYAVTWNLGDVNLFPEVERYYAREENIDGLINMTFMFAKDDELFKHLFILNKDWCVMDGDYEEID